MKKYSVPGGTSPSAVLSTCSVMKFFAEWTAYTAVYGMVKLHSSEDKFIYLIFLYNVVCASGMLLFGLVSDRVSRGKPGIMLGAALLGIGFALPASFGVTVKTAFSALGIAALNAFGASEICRTEGSRGLSVFFGSGVLGYGVGRFNMFYGYVAVFAAVLCAALAPSDVKSTVTGQQCDNRKIIRKVSFPVSLVGTAALACAVESGNVFCRIYKRRDVLIASVLFFAGTVAYYVVKKFVKNGVPDVILPPLAAAAFCCSSLLLGNGIVRTAAVMISLGFVLSAFLETAGKISYRGIASAALFASLYAGHSVLVFTGGGFLLFAVILFVASAAVAALSAGGRYV